MTKPSRKIALAGAVLVATAAVTVTASATVQAESYKPGGSGTVLAMPEGPNKWTAPPPDAP